jgi:hypothetical protein
MRILSLLIFSGLVIFLNQKSNSPHGPGFKISCKVCHSPEGWQLDKKIYSFDHNKTKLPLIGQHIQVNCRQCHPTLVFSGAKTNCVECHNDIHQATVGVDCSHCHTPYSWLVNNINEIHQLSRFPLTGVHRTADCSQCHKSESLLRFDVQGINCIDCHRDKYLATTNPNHVLGGISEDCFLCHSVRALQWTGAGFNHNIFPLTLGHSALKCTDCHTTGNFSDAKTDCYTCHQQDFLTAKNPDHSLSKFSTACQDCHSLNAGWRPASFNHTGFPLTLGHASPACADCHKDGNYINTSADCYSCHQADYNSAISPNHKTSGFPVNCTLCHNTNPGWKPASFNHSSFPLTQGHSSPACADCHKNGNYASISTACYSCHQQDFTAATNPNHIASGIPTTCNTCHTLNPGWAPAHFNHTTFPLTLGHATPTCNDCHKGNYTITSTDCFSCHQTDYNNSVNPSHKTLAFAITCTQCHTTNPGWKPATYAQHDAQFFPIYSGRHLGTWTLCSECHTNTSNYLLYDCIRCHTTVHRGSNYTNARCYSCHPRGTAG